MHFAGAELCGQRGWSLPPLPRVLQLQGPGEVGDLPVWAEFLTLVIDSVFFQCTQVTGKQNEMPTGETPTWGIPPSPEPLRQMQTGSSEYLKGHGKACELLGIPSSPAAMTFHCWCEVPIASKTCPQVLR